jgi:hypothetical protein
MARGYKGWWMALTGRSMGALVARADAVGTMASHYPPLKNKSPPRPLFLFVEE